MSTNEVTITTMGGHVIPVTNVKYSDNTDPYSLPTGYTSPGVYTSGVPRRRLGTRTLTSARAITLDVPPALALRT